MYIIPALGLMLTFVLFAGSRTIAADMERLGRWMSGAGGDSDGARAFRNDEPLFEHPEETLPAPAVEQEP